MMLSGLDVLNAFLTYDVFNLQQITWMYIPGFVPKHIQSINI